MATRHAPDLDSRERLLRAGLARARQGGLRQLTVRGVAADAEANLGSFVYHFGSREAFVDELIERLYAPLFERLQLSAGAGGDALENLRTVMLQLVAWLVEHRDFIAHLLLDAGAGEKAAQRFMQSMDRRHPALLLELIAQAQASGRLRREDPLHVMLFLMSTLAVPVVMFHLAGQRGLAPAPLAAALTAYTTDLDKIALRLDWALRALAPEEHPA
jgi:AcrR family transcriptional regulator